MKQDKTPLTRSAFVSGFRAALVQAGYQNSDILVTFSEQGLQPMEWKTPPRTLGELGIPYLPSPTKNRFATSVKTIIRVPGPGNGVMSFTNSTELISS